jgi:secretion/DNA translocation related CpaE-like protein
VLSTPFDPIIDERPAVRCAAFTASSQGDRVEGIQMDARPLVVTDDEDLLDELLRIAAAAGVEINHARTADSRAFWRSAPVVLLDARQVRGAVLARLPRRSGVIVVSASEPDGNVWEHCVLLGVERTVLLPQAEDLLVAVLADSVHRGPGGGRVVSVIGARGGAGSSMLAAAVAVAGLRSGAGVVLADCDPWGAGLDVLLGLESDPGLRWPDLATPVGRVPVDALHESLPSVDGPRRRPAARHPWRGPEPGVLSVLSFGRDDNDGAATPPDTLTVVIDACRRAGELAVLDVPRTADPLGDLALENSDLVVMVATADLFACYAARRIVDRIDLAGARAGLVVRGPSPGGLGADDLARSLELPLIAHMRPQPHLARDVELGHPPGEDPRSPLGRAARRILAAVSSPQLPG